MTKTEERISELMDINAERQQMLWKLVGLGANFPDDDLRILFDYVKDETKKRYDETWKMIGKLEDEVETEASA